MIAGDGSSVLSAPGSLLTRGMRDLLPEEMARFRRIERAFLDAARAWGYAEVRTPTIEHLYLFTSTGTLAPQVLTNVYSFFDWDGWTGERVVLRPEATIPVARLYREQLGRARAKLAYVVNTFRFHAGDEPRESWQCGAEAIGVPWPEGDIEALALALNVLRALGLADVGVEIAHAGVARLLLEHAGYAPEEVAELYDRLLTGETTLQDEVGGRLPELSSALRLLDVAPGTEGYLANLRAAFASVPALAAPLDEVATLAAAARGFGIVPRIAVAPQRDFEYYTGPVFRLSLGETVVASGGRYDRLVLSAEGVPVPACGFAIFVDRLLPLLPARDERPPAFVRVRPAEETAEGYALAAEAVAGLQQRGLLAGLAAPENTPRWTLTVGATERYLLSGRTAGAGVGLASLDDVVAMVRGLQP